MANKLRIETSVIILTDEKEPEAIGKKDLVVYVVDEASGAGVEGVVITFTPDNYVLVDKPEVTSDTNGRCVVSVALNYDLVQQWASKTFVDVTIKDDATKTSRVNVYYGTLPQIDFLNIKQDINGIYFYDKYEQEDKTSVVVHKFVVNKPIDSLELQLYLDNNVYRKRLTSDTLPLTVDLREYFEKDVFSDGMHDLYYTLVDEASNIAASENFSFRLDFGTSERLLPPIEVPRLVNGYINHRYWVDGVEYDFTNIINKLMEELGVNTPAEILPLLDVDAVNPVILRYQGLDLKGKYVDLKGESAKTFNKDEFDKNVIQNNLIFKDKPGSDDPDRYRYIKEGTLVVDVSIKTITVDRAMISNVKRVLVDIVPPAKEEEDE